MSEEKLDELKTITFEEGSNLKVLEEFSPKLKDPGNFSIPYMVGNVSIAMVLCDLGSSVSLMPEA